MKLVVAAVGRLKDRETRDLAQEYERRVSRYVGVEHAELKDDRGFERFVGTDAFIVALEVGGERLSSERFARNVERWASRNKGVVVFCIGGAEGLPASLSERADYSLSLSDMTLPHRLARVVLLEQLYRAMTILRGEPYAREG